MSVGTALHQESFRSQLCRYRFGAQTGGSSQHKVLIIVSGSVWRYLVYQLSYYLFVHLVSTWVINWILWELDLSMKQGKCHFLLLIDNKPNVWMGLLCLFICDGSEIPALNHTYILWQLACWHSCSLLHKGLFAPWNQVEQLWSKSGKYQLCMDLEALVWRFVCFLHHAHNCNTASLLLMCHGCVCAPGADVCNVFFSKLVVC